jgi:D-hydroxyproline dehydrogenase subunit alpha
VGDAAAGHVEVDVAVIGAGPAGIAAAVRAAETGARVAVLDQGIQPGGQIWRHATRAHLPLLARRWLERLDRSGAQLLCSASVFDIAPDRSIAVEHRGERATVSTDRVVLATGARERFLPFPGWTLPGVLGVGGAQALLKAGASFAGKRIVIAGSGPLLLPVAGLLAQHGARLELVAEQAPAARVLRFGAALWRFPGKIRQAAAFRMQFPRARYALGRWVVSASGDDRVREVTLTDGRRCWSQPCDVLCTGYGLIPNSEIARQIGCMVENGFVVTDPWQRTGIAGVYCAGEPTGIAGVEAALLEGEIAGLAACGRSAQAARLLAARNRYRRFGRRLELDFAPRDELRSVPTPDTLVCRCEDVRLGCLRPDWTARQAKLYTRVGMGACQGRVCGPALEFLFSWSPPTVRSPVDPASAAALANVSLPRR